ncbi:hypothetical protein QTO34_017025 [Cnephaeus nilssonii]|uniref:Integrase-type domain-containing protein n=1 Tax=Cnephaeus nilssonii TaxID=3371016 RepID=A0AA40LPH7_CNENI|nr:hypothetical protein QTO34_017025 [Eptesicus nilssonii]
MMWGRGHVCIFPEGAPNLIWVPERVVHHAHGPGKIAHPAIQEAENHSSRDDASSSTNPEEGEKQNAVEGYTDTKSGGFGRAQSPS